MTGMISAGRFESMFGFQKCDLGHGTFTGDLL